VTGGKELKRTKKRLSPRSSNGDDKTIGMRLRARRLECNLSQSDLGQRLGVTFQQIQKYEEGANRISGSKLLKVCTILKCDPNLLLGGNGPTPMLAVDGTLQLAHKLSRLTDQQRSAMRALVAAIKVLD
jgi:transcriptional regulator with XRE-family HTH domain